MYRDAFPEAVGAIEAATDDMVTTFTDHKNWKRYFIST